MKKIFVLSLLYIVVNNFSMTQVDRSCDLYNAMLTEEPVGCNNNPWYLVFEDNFNGSSLDTAKWTVPYQGVLRDFNYNEGKQWYAIQVIPQAFQSATT